ncbi:hypothetical protein RUM44_008826 [Polyplax serrata]|uniref:Uncharacterized protein n=1 Tax=Polyplax serrata TaxID=468196 RepID=A0ABR1B9N0_POLSC
MKNETRSGILSRYDLVKPRLNELGKGDEFNFIAPFRKMNVQNLINYPGMNPSVWPKTRTNTQKHFDGLPEGVEERMTQENVGVPGRNNRERREPEKIDCPTDKSKMKEEKGGNL